jgi:hypothetical protein
VIDGAVVQASQNSKSIENCNCLGMPALSGVENTTGQMVAQVFGSGEMCSAPLMAGSAYTSLRKRCFHIGNRHALVYLWQVKMPTFVGFI